MPVTAMLDRRMLLPALGLSLLLAAAGAARPAGAEAPATPPAAAPAQAGVTLQLVAKGASLTLDRAGLEALGAVEFTSHTPWDVAPSRFRGVRLTDLVAAHGGTAKAVIGRAINAYSATIPLDDADWRHAVLAFERDGQPMRIRDRGPFWIVFPWSERPNLDNAKIKGWSIWQLQELSIVGS